MGKGLVEVEVDHCEAMEGGEVVFVEPVVACPFGEGDGRLPVFLWTGS